MRMTTPAWLLAAFAIAADPAAGQHDGAGHAGGAGGPPGTLSPYAGEAEREVAGLSAEDLAELRRGGGWGLALPAELNGVPGPAHLLEMGDAIGLSAEQAAAIGAIEEAMRRDAMAAGARLIEAERALDAAFRDGVPNGAALRRRVEKAGAAQARLRLVHLAAHLAVAEVVSPEQAARYARMRDTTGKP